jgi:hypothetical protein
MDTWTDLMLLVEGKEGKWWLCLQLLQYCYITVLWVHGLTVMLLVKGRGEMAVLLAVTAVLLHRSAMDTWTDCSVLVQGRGEMAVLPAVTAVLLHHSAMDTWTDCNVVSTG